MKGYKYLTTHRVSVSPGTGREKQNEAKKEGMDWVKRDLIQWGVASYRITVTRKCFGRLCPITFVFRIYVAEEEYSPSLRNVALGRPPDYDFLAEYMEHANVRQA